MNATVNLLMNQIKNQNPQAYNMITQAMNSGANPQELVKQFMGDVSPEQLSSIMATAKQYGVPDEVLSQLQNNK